jgi:hypothetical protein
MARPQGDLLLRPPPLLTAMMNFVVCIFHPVLLWFRLIVMMRFLSHKLSFLSFPRHIVSCLSSSPSPPIVRPQPALQAEGCGWCPLDMFNSDVLLLFLRLLVPPQLPVQMFALALLRRLVAVGCP